MSGNNDLNENQRKLLSPKDDFERCDIGADPTTKKHRQTPSARLKKCGDDNDDDQKETAPMQTTIDNEVEASLSELTRKHPYGTTTAAEELLRHVDKKRRRKQNQNNNWIRRTTETGGEQPTPNDTSFREVIHHSSNAAIASAAIATTSCSSSCSWSSRPSDSAQQRQDHRAGTQIARANNHHNFDTTTPIIHQTGGVQKRSRDKAEKTANRAAFHDHHPRCNFASFSPPPSSASSVQDLNNNNNWNRTACGATKSSGCSTTGVSNDNGGSSYCSSSSSSSSHPPTSDDEGRDFVVPTNDFVVAIDDNSGFGSQYLPATMQKAGNVGSRQERHVQPGPSFAGLTNYLATRNTAASILGNDFDSSSRCQQHSWPRQPHDYMTEETFRRDRDNQIQQRNGYHREENGNGGGDDEDKNKNI